MILLWQLKKAKDLLQQFPSEIQQSFRHQIGLSENQRIVEVRDHAQKEYEEETKTNQSLLQHNPARPKSGTSIFYFAVKRLCQLHGGKKLRVYPVLDAR